MTGPLAGVAGTMGSTQISGSINVAQNGVYVGYGFGPSTGNVAVGSCGSGVCYPGLPTFNCSGGTGEFVGFINGGGVDFIIINSQAGKSQSCFTGVRVQDSAGVVREYLSASAGFNNSGQTQWYWGTSSNPVWPVGFSGARSVEWF
jgi:hypothetical protein